MELSVLVVQNFQMEYYGQILAQSFSTMKIYIQLHKHKFVLLKDLLKILKI